MNLILVIVISGAVAYALGYRLGVKRGRLERRLEDYRRGFSKGYGQAQKEITELSGLEDEELLSRMRRLRESPAGTPDK
jgi:hypothetical protein